MVSPISITQAAHFVVGIVGDRATIMLLDPAHDRHGAGSRRRCGSKTTHSETLGADAAAAVQAADSSCGIATLILPPM
jgi:hypothetical protein